MGIIYRFLYNINHHDIMALGALPSVTVAEIGSYGSPFRGDGHLFIRLSF